MASYETTLVLTLIEPDEYPTRIFVVLPGVPFHIGRYSTSARSLDKRLGPSASNAIFDNPIVSRKHAELTVGSFSGVIKIRDLSSMHGTYLNGDRLKAQELAHVRSGDQITLGRAGFDENKIFPADQRYRTCTFNVMIEKNLKCPTALKSTTFPSQQTNILKTSTFVDLSSPVPTPAHPAIPRDKKVVSTTTYTVPDSSSESSDEDREVLDKMLAEDNGDLSDEILNEVLDRADGKAIEDENEKDTNRSSSPAPSGSISNCSEISMSLEHEYTKSIASSDEEDKDVQDDDEDDYDHDVNEDDGDKTHDESLTIAENGKIGLDLDISSDSEEDAEDDEHENDEEDDSDEDEGNGSLSKLHSPRPTTASFQDSRPLDSIQPESTTSVTKANIGVGQTQSSPKPHTPTSAFPRWTPQSSNLNDHQRAPSPLPAPSSDEEKVLARKAGMRSVAQVPASSTSLSLQYLLASNEADPKAFAPNTKLGAAKDRDFEPTVGSNYAFAPSHPNATSAAAHNAYRMDDNPYNTFAGYPHASALPEAWHYSQVPTLVGCSFGRPQEAFPYHPSPLDHHQSMDWAFDRRKTMCTYPYSSMPPKEPMDMPLDSFTKTTDSSRVSLPNILSPQGVPGTTRDTAQPMKHSDVPTLGPSAPAFGPYTDSSTITPPMSLAGHKRKADGSMKGSSEDVSPTAKRSTGMPLLRSILNEPIDVDERPLVAPRSESTKKQLDQARVALRTAPLQSSTVPAIDWNAMCRTATIVTDDLAFDPTLAPCVDNAGSAPMSAEKKDEYEERPRKTQRTALTSVAAAGAGVNEVSSSNRATQTLENKPLQPSRVQRQMTNRRSLCSTISQEAEVRRRVRKAKTSSFAIGAMAGTLIGGIGMLGALFSIPDSWLL